MSPTSSPGFFAPPPPPPKTLSARKRASCSEPHSGDPVQAQPLRQAPGGHGQATGCGGQTAPAEGARRRTRAVPTRAPLGVPAGAVPPPPPGSVAPPALPQLQGGRRQDQPFGGLRVPAR